MKPSTRHLGRPDGVPHPHRCPERHTTTEPLMAHQQITAPLLARLIHRPYPRVPLFPCKTEVSQPNINCTCHLAGALLYTQTHGKHIKQLNVPEGIPLGSLQRYPSFSNIFWLLSVGVVPYTADHLKALWWLLTHLTNKDRRESYHGRCQSLNLSKPQLGIGSEKSLHGNRLWTNYPQDARRAASSCLPHLGRQLRAMEMWDLGLSQCLYSCKHHDHEAS